MIEDSSFFGGQYCGKVLVVHSEVKAEAEEKMVRNLLQVENTENPIEIVIHVNMLREGWDIVNLYTMVPLRKANSKTLIEQNLGRGLRLPFGRLTGRKEIDTHTVVSHDRFNEIIDAANSENSIIRQGIIIGKDVPLEPLSEIEVFSKERLEIEDIESHEERSITLKAYDAINSFGIESKEDVISYIQKELGVQDKQNVELVVEKFFNKHQEKAIYIPRIYVEPKVIQNGRFLPFQLDLHQIAIKPFGENIIVQGLINGERVVQETKGTQYSKEKEENQLIMYLLDSDEVSESDENGEIARSCVDQLINHLKSYLKSDDEVNQVIRQQGVQLAKIIRAQMLDHFEEPIIEWDKEVAEKMMPLRNMRFPSYGKDR